MLVIKSWLLFSFILLCFCIADSGKEHFINMKSIRYVTNVGNMPMNKFGRIFRQENQPILCFQFIFIYRVCTMMYSGSVMFLIKSLIIILSESSLPVYDFNERKLREICVNFLASVP